MTINRKAVASRSFVHSADEGWEWGKRMGGGGLGGWGVDRKAVHSGQILETAQQSFSY